MAYKWKAFIAVALGTFMGTMDVGGLFIALPTFGRLFKASPETVLWLVLAYSLTLTGFMLTAGRIADIVGRKRVYTTGFLVFTLGLILSSTAQGLWQLVAYRVFQGIGGAMLISNSNAIIASAFPSNERGKALGLLESVVGAGLMAGPAIGGLLLELLGWRSIFYIRIPLGVLGFFFAWWVLREAVREGPKPRFDLGGALTLFVGLVLLMVVINRGHRIGWTEPPIVALGIGSVVLLGLFLLIESRVREPVVELRLFKNRTFSAYNAVLLTYFIPSGAIPFLLPFFLVEGIGYTESIAGLFLTVIPILMFLFSPATGTLSDRIGSWPMMTVGIILQLVGYFFISRLGLESSGLHVALGLGVLGVGAGLFLTPTYSAVLGATPPDRMGTTSAIIATLRTVGISTGQATSATIFAVRRDFHEGALTSGLDGAERVRQGLAMGFQDTFLAIGFVALVGVLIALAFARPAARKQALQKAHHPH